MSQTIKLNEISLVCDKPHNIKCWKKGKEIKHPHPLKWYPDGGEIVVLKRWKLEVGGGPWVPHTWRDLRKVQVQLEEELDKFGYKDRDLILYRTIRASQINWDSIAVFSEKRGQTE